MNKVAKIAIGVCVVGGALVVASKAKNALKKITFRITGFQIIGFTAGGLKVRFRSEFTNDTGQSFSASDLLSKLLYKDGAVYSEFARAASIPKVEFIHATPKTIDSIFTIDLTQLPYLFKSETFRVSTFFTALMVEESLDYDIKISEMKAQVMTLLANAPFVPNFIKNAILSKSALKGYDAPFVNAIDLTPNQYSVV